jgi:tRNA threonylcarbamoyl adenosine modification protein (Sua5/YciO/YrdC/YwlC family)
VTELVRWGQPGVLDRVAAALRQGEVVVIPTDTVYGVAVDPFVPGAAARLFAAKQRPADVALPVLVDGLDQAWSLVDEARVTAPTRRLMERCWPGPLTVVLPRRAGLALDLGGDETTVGLRWPDHDVPRGLCLVTGPLATTSANLHGQPTAPTAAEVAARLGDAVALVVDGGRCEGAPSTVVDATGPEPRLLRTGRLPWEQVEAAAQPSGVHEGDQ